MNTILPSHLRFRFVDFDDEENLAYARSVQSASLALSNLIKEGIITPQEARKQLVEKGFLTIDLPEKIDESELPQPEMQGGDATARQRNEGMSLLQGTLPESMGGGVRQKQVSNADRLKLAGTFREKFDGVLEKTNDARLRKIIRAVLPLVYAQRRYAKSQMDTEEELLIWDKSFTEYTAYENDEYPESVDKARKRLYEIAYDVIDWTDMDTAGLQEIMRSMYAAGLKEKAQEMLDYLFENGLIPYG